MPSVDEVAQRDLDAALGPDVGHCMLLGEAYAYAYAYAYLYVFTMLLEVRTGVHFTGASGCAVTSRRAHLQSASRPSSYLLQVGQLNAIETYLDHTIHGRILFELLSKLGLQNCQERSGV